MEYSMVGFPTLREGKWVGNNELAVCYTNFSSCRSATRVDHSYWLPCRLVPRRFCRRWKRFWTYSFKRAASWLCFRRMAARPRRRCFARPSSTAWPASSTTSRSWNCSTRPTWRSWPTCRRCRRPCTARLEQFEVVDDRWRSRNTTARCRIRPFIGLRLLTWYMLLVQLSLVISQEERR